VTLERLSLSLTAIAFCAGAIYAGNWAIEEWRYRALLADRALVAGDRDSSAKPQRVCPDPNNTKVFVVFGQSNAANYGAVRKVAPFETYDFFDDRCYSGDDPQFGATGKGGSLWPSFGFAQREIGEYRPILISNVAVGNTRIEEWQPGTDHANHLLEQTHGLLSRGYQISAFLFFQGESDRKTPEAEYRKGLNGIANLTEGLSVGTPLILSDSSVCALENLDASEPSLTLVAARAVVAAERAHVFVGPDTDKIGEKYRYDGCHFNADGLEIIGARWSVAVEEIITSE